MTKQVEFGWGARKFSEQFPQLSEDEASHFDKDNDAMIRLKIRGYLTPSQKDSVMKKIARSIEKSLNR